MLVKETDSRIERAARAICRACDENPDHKGDAQGNAYRWQDYAPAAIAALAEGDGAVAEELEQLRAVADGLIAFQDEYVAATADQMPGNDYYRPKLVQLVNMARAAREQ